MDIDLLEGAVICGTGHRPNKLGGYHNWEVTSSTIIDKLTYILNEATPKLIISGMAQGLDLCLADAAVRCKIPFHAYIPCIGQERKWPSGAREYYQALLSKAEHINVSAKEYTPQCMQLRNIAMVDAVEVVLALWDGTSGGTANCIQYAESKQRPIINIWHMIFGRSYGEDCVREE